MSPLRGFTAAATLEISGRKNPGCAHRPASTTVMLVKAGVFAIILPMHETNRMISLGIVGAALIAFASFAHCAVPAPDPASAAPTSALAWIRQPLSLADALNIA